MRGGSITSSSCGYVVVQPLQLRGEVDGSGLLSKSRGRACGEKIRNASIQASSVASSIMVPSSLSASSLFGGSTGMPNCHSFG